MNGEIGVYSMFSVHEGKKRPFRESHMTCGLRWPTTLKVKRSKLGSRGAQALRDLFLSLLDAAWIDPGTPELMADTGLRESDWSLIEPADVVATKDFGVSIFLGK